MSAHTSFGAHTSAHSSLGAHTSARMCAFLPQEPICSPLHPVSAFRGSPERDQGEGGRTHIQTPLICAYVTSYPRCEVALPPDVGGRRPDVHPLNLRSPPLSQGPLATLSGEGGYGVKEGYGVINISLYLLLFEQQCRPRQTGSLLGVVGVCHLQTKTVPGAVQAANACKSSQCAVHH